MEELQEDCILLGSFPKAHDPTAQLRWHVEMTWARGQARRREKQKEVHREEKLLYPELGKDPSSFVQYCT